MFHREKFCFLSARRASFFYTLIQTVFYIVLICTVAHYYRKRHEMVDMSNDMIPIPKDDKRITKVDMSNDMIPIPKDDKRIIKVDMKNDMLIPPKEEIKKLRSGSNKIKKTKNVEFFDFMETNQIKKVSFNERVRRSLHKHHSKHFHHYHHHGIRHSALSVGVAVSLWILIAVMGLSLSGKCPRFTQAVDAVYFGLVCVFNVLVIILLIHKSSAHHWHRCRHFFAKHPNPMVMAAVLGAVALFALQWIVAHVVLLAGACKRHSLFYVPMLGLHIFALLVKGLSVVGVAFMILSHNPTLVTLTLTVTVFQFMVLLYQFALFYSAYVETHKNPCQTMGTGGSVFVLPHPALRINFTNPPNYERLTEEEDGAAKDKLQIV